MPNKFPEKGIIIYHATYGRIMLFRSVRFILANIFGITLKYYTILARVSNIPFETNGNRFGDCVKKH